MSFEKSDKGAQASWKGYSSQTLYIASRIVEEDDQLAYFPEQLEDLLIKLNGEVTEIVQIKDLDSNLSISNLSSTDASMNNEGFFRRALSLKNSDSKPVVVKVLHFGELGEELLSLFNGCTTARNRVKNKLNKNHGLLDEEAEWILNNLIFEKADKQELQLKISRQIQSYIPTMIAPNLMQDLLIQYVSNLSITQNFTSKTIWFDKINQIGLDMASIDGYFREYGSALIRLTDLKSYKSYEELKTEYDQGISAHPAHIRNDLDFERREWLDKIKTAFQHKRVVIVKGASGQGKTSLCYKYLIENYLEELVFCVRRIESHGQAENLVKAILGLSKHTSNIALYIDVSPGQNQWTWIIRELQMRGTSFPLVVSIREEDFKQSNVDMSELSFELIELTLSEKEALQVYNKFTSDNPHNVFRSFEEAWRQFGSAGPFLEFVYILINNEPLEQRLRAQINKLIDDGQEEWLNFLLLVCYAGRLGSPLLLTNLITVVDCKNITSALKRMTDEYLIRTIEDGKYIEALHPVRAKIIYTILKNQMAFNEKDILTQSLFCVENLFPQILIMHYFTENKHDIELISRIAEIRPNNWITFYSIFKTMLWIDVKRYVEQNKAVFDRLVLEKGIGWNCFLPLDISGELGQTEFIADILSSINPQIIPFLEEIKKELSNYTIDYSTTHRWLSLSIPPQEIPITDLEWSSFGYILYWYSLRKKDIEIPFLSQIVSKMDVGIIENKLHAVSGLHKQGLIGLYNECEIILRNRLIEQYKILWMNITENSVECGFVPPYFQKDKTVDEKKSINNFWTMEMVNLLSYLYPSKDVIAVKLVGIDLLADLEIEAMDFEKRISRKNNPNKWITEVNSWLMSRVELMYRPEDWNAYLKEISNMRQEIVSALNEFIHLIDNFYKKKFWDNVKSKKSIIKIQSLYHLLAKNISLPKAILDPYGLNSEGMISDSKLLTRNSISVQPYNEFIRSFRSVVSSLKTFFNQYTDVIDARIKNKDIQSNLSLINIYEVAKGIYNLQREFQNLFYMYSNQDYMNFTIIEQDTILTTLNIWEDVFEQPPRGFILSYNAKQRSKKTKQTIHDCFYTVIKSLGNKISVYDCITEKGENIKYLLYEDFLSDSNTIQDQYKLLCLELRKTWAIARKYNSSRWILETQWPRMAFIPLYQGLPLFGGYEMPIYRILDTNEEQISSPLFPCEINDEIYSQYGMNNSQILQWRESFSELGKLRMLMVQYNQVIEEISIHNEFVLTEGVSEYLRIMEDDMNSAINIAANGILQGISLLTTITDEEIQGSIHQLGIFLDSLEGSISSISSLQKAEEAPELLLNIISIMILLLPYMKSTISV